MLGNLERFGADHFLEESNNVVATVMGLDTQSVAAEASGTLSDSFTLSAQMCLEILAYETSFKALRALYLRLCAVFFLMPFHLWDFECYATPERALHEAFGALAQMFFEF